MRFAVLHGLERLVGGDTSDVDIVVDEPPCVVLRQTAASWGLRGVMPVLVCPYDIGGAAAVWLALSDASEAVQLDLLYDPRGVGCHRLKSPALLATADLSQSVPVVSDAASLIYQWQKRTVKRQVARLNELTAIARTIDEHALLAASEVTTGSSDAARHMLSGRPVLRAQRINRPWERGIRLMQRVVRPVGYWAHTAAAGVGAELACRFSRFLVYAKTQPTPSVMRQPTWWATSIMPIRLRPGIFVSTGQLPQWRTPDLVLTAPSTDEAARELTAAMAARVNLRTQRRARG